MEKVKVFIRIKPGASEISHSSSSLSIRNPRNRQETLNYTLDRVFGPSDSQEMVWNSCKDTVNQALKGKNVTLFAYGQTSSGKTFTMMDNGIIQNAVTELLKNKGASINASFLEIYNERIFDLLDTSARKSGLELRQIGSGMAAQDVLLAGINRYQDFTRNIELALKNRSTASTNLNMESSRSHFILQLNFECNGVISKIHLIDLAGSEDNKRTGNVGVRLNEVST